MKQFWKRAAVAIVSLALLAGMPPAAGAASDEVEAALASMTLREKVGQLFAVRPEALDFEQRSGGGRYRAVCHQYFQPVPDDRTDPGFSAFRREQPSGRGG